MPYAENFADLPRLTYKAQTLALFGSPALHTLKDVLDQGAAASGRRARGGYPPLLHYAVAVIARIYGSQRKALSELGADGLWEQVCEEYLKHCSQPVSLPSTPPTEAQQDRFVRRLCDDTNKLDALSAAFTRAGVGQAKYLGNFADTGLPDYAKPDPRHTVFGDGTYIAPYSSVIETKDAANEKVVLGSRATKGPARIQHTLTDPKPDQKTARGINHVTLTTWTTAGWVVLGNAQSLSAEVHEARQLIAAVHDLLQERLHTVVWDRILKGQDLQDLMGQRRLMVVTKPVARATNSRRSDGYTAPVLTPEQARALVKEGAPLPLGTSVYPRSDERPAESTRSCYYRYKTVDIDDCAHDLWVDDGALVVVEQDKRGWLVKTGHATAITSVPLLDNDFTVHTAWRLPCPNAPQGVHEFESHWRPHARRPSTGENRAAYDLRPIARLDVEKFASVHGLRNITESYNSWFKSRLGDHKRAMRLNPRAQFLDQICVGTLANALTMNRHQRLTRRAR